MKGLKHIYGGQGGSRGGNVTMPKLEGGQDRPGFHKGYGNSGGAIETLEVGTPLAGSGRLLPSEAEDLGQDSRFYHKYGLAGPIETLETGSMSPRAKKVRYPRSAGQAASALRRRF